MAPVVGNLGAARTRNETAFVACVTFASRDVIGVVQELVHLVVGLVVGQVFEQEERLEEPRDVGSMPFCGADIGHRLDLLVFWRQGRGEGFGFVSNCLVVVNRDAYSQRFLRHKRSFALTAISHNATGAGICSESVTIFEQAKGNPRPN